ncbi:MULTISPECIES: cellulose binding domain-containing protein [unclassified Nonomuraea]|uniref:cellulose binding domain-containing protein n=1 Tax=unclassified Nonomuraea TaxID=2593643 RepID=UPI0033D06C89
MLRRSHLYAALAALLAALTLGAGLYAPSTAGVGNRSAAAPVRVMPLGDSITAGPGCWRAMLWHRLQTAGYTDIDFVGSVPDGGCGYGYSYDGDNEGHGGYAATGIADQNQLPPWLVAARPDIVLMHLGTNDMWGGFIPTSTVLAAYTKLVGQMRANNPDMKIIVAQIIPMNPSGCTTCAADVKALDNAIPGWAAGLTTARSPIVVVDQWTGFDTATDTGDGVHPNDTGFQKMADRWFPALARVLDGVIPSSSPSPSPSPSPSATSGRCAATYRLISQWGGSFQAEVTVRNESPAASAAWTAAFTFADGQRVSQSWNTTLTQSGAAVTARNAGYNGALTAGASATFGFIASWNGSVNTPPRVTCTLG